MDNPSKPYIDKLPLLADPFEESEIKWKPQAVKGNRAMAVAYIDARCVQDRLDSVLGPHNWQDSYTVLPDGLTILCKLMVRFGPEWMVKEDVGCPSEQPDGGDRVKAAFSDALKRAGVKWGIGRYLYSLPQTWCDYDPTKRSFVSPPRLPEWAKPKKEAKPAVDPALGQMKKGTDIPAPTTINKGQLDQLQAKMIQANVTPKQMADRFKVAKIEDMTGEMFDKAKLLLDDRIKVMLSQQPA